MPLFNALSGSFRFIIRSISWVQTRNSATRATNLIYHRSYRIQHSGPIYSSRARLSSVFMRLIKERKQNSCTPCAKTQGFEKKGGKLRCSIVRGKIAGLGLNYFIGKSEPPGVREISLEQRAK